MKQPLIPTYIGQENGAEDMTPIKAAYILPTYQEARRLLGHVGMQTVRVSGMQEGMGTALGCGTYVEIEHDPKIFQAIAEYLERKIAELQPIARQWTDGLAQE